ncbi:hypothetical protein EJ110_NYTH51906 [Nymphaea thermarum]|nr:hypothetical protein EJ110_NYTH51906 [Nymphaea thermarum]
MEFRVSHALLNKLSCAAIIATSIALIFLSTTHPRTFCSTPHHHHRLPTSSRSNLLRFPRSSCEARRRDVLSPDRRAERLRSTSEWRRRVDSLASLFRSLASRGLLRNSSRALCVSAGAGHEVAALSEGTGLADVTGVEIVDSPPLVSRADPHNLPFFDSVFDFAFSARLADALFPARFVKEMERTVRPGGVLVVTLERPCSGETIGAVKLLFGKSEVLSITNATLIGVDVVEIVFRKKMHP